MTRNPFKKDVCHVRAVYEVMFINSKSDGHTEVSVYWNDTSKKIFILEICLVEDNIFPA
jgi:hypothetical protein